MPERERAPYCLYLLFSLLTLGAYALYELRAEEKEIAAITGHKLDLPPFFAQVLLIYLTLFLYKLIRIDSLLMTVRSDYLILSAVDPRITEEGYGKALWSLPFTFALSSPFLAYLSYAQHGLLLRTYKQRLRRRLMGNSLLRYEMPSDVVYYEPYRKKKRRPHIDVGDVVYYRPKEEELPFKDDDVVYLERRADRKTLKMRK